MLHYFQSPKLAITAIAALLAHLCLVALALA